MRPHFLIILNPAKFAVPSIIRNPKTADETRMSNGFITILT